MVVVYGARFTILEHLGYNGLGSRWYTSALVLDLADGALHKVLVGLQAVDSPVRPEDNHCGAQNTGASVFQPDSRSAGVSYCFMTFGITVLVLPPRIKEEYG